MSKFAQVCVWPGCIVGPESVEAFEAHMLKVFNARTKYLEEVLTAPDKDKKRLPNRRYRRPERLVFCGAY